MAVYLVPSGDALRDEIKVRYPAARVDWIGDRLHAVRVSDHNPERWAAERVWDGAVHAIDVFDSGVADLDDLVEFLRSRADRGLEFRLKNIIRKSRIASAKTGWEWVRYDGTNPHTTHAHFSFSYVSAYETNRSSWLTQFRLTPALAQTAFGEWYTGAAGSRTCQLWSAGEDVKLLQTFIGNCVNDGYFGRQTETAVKWYQDLRGIDPIDGVAGSKTWAPILSALGR